MNKRGGNGVRDRYGRRWANPTICPDGPDYELPWTGRQIDDAILSQYHPSDLFVAYLPLPFRSYPAWPCVWNDRIYNRKRGTAQQQQHYDDAAHPERFANLFCVRCKERIEDDGQLVMYVISGILQSVHANPPGLTTDARLVCRVCLGPESEHLHHSVSYFPFMLLAQSRLNNFLEPWKADVMTREGSFLQQQGNTCIICRRTRPGGTIHGNKGHTMTICKNDDSSQTRENDCSGGRSASCLRTFQTLLHWDPLHYGCYPCVPASERVYSLLFELCYELVDSASPHNNKNNLNARLCWDYCSHCCGTVDITGFECKECFRVQYCSTACTRKGIATHRTYCQPWTGVFENSHLVILYERSITLSQTLRMFECIEEYLGDAKG